MREITASRPSSPAALDAANETPWREHSGELCANSRGRLLLKAPKASESARAATHNTLLATDLRHRCSVAGRERERERHKNRNNNRRQASWCQSSVTYCTPKRKIRLSSVSPISVRTHHLAGTFFLNTNKCTKTKQWKTAGPFTL